jgi:hypothetical protein
MGGLATANDATDKRGKLTNDATRVAFTDLTNEKAGSTTFRFNSVRGP